MGGGSEGEGRRQSDEVDLRDIPAQIVRDEFSLKKGKQFCPFHLRGPLRLDVPSDITAVPAHVFIYLDEFVKRAV
jgi:hypothetical protein